MSELEQFTSVVTSGFFLKRVVALTTVLVIVLLVVFLVVKNWELITVVVAVVLFVGASVWIYREAKLNFMAQSLGDGEGGLY